MTESYKICQFTDQPQICKVSSVTGIRTLLQWFEHLVNHENMFETGVVRANDCLSKRQVRRHNRDSLLIFINIRVCCVYKQHTIINIIKKSPAFIQSPIKFAAMRLLLGSQERVRNSCGKRTIMCSSHRSSVVNQTEVTSRIYTYISK